MSVIRGTGAEQLELGRSIARMYIASRGVSREVVAATWDLMNEMVKHQLIRNGFNEVLDDSIYSDHLPFTRFNLKE